MERVTQLGLPGKEDARFSGLTSAREIARDLGQEFVDAKGSDGDGVFDVVKVYKNLHAEHLGHRPDSVGPTMQRALLRAQQCCEKNGYDTTVYLAAQFYAIKLMEGGQWTPGFRGKFIRPQMFLGERALYRYNVHVRSLERTYQHAAADVTDRLTPTGKLRAMLIENEVYFGEAIVLGAQCGRPVTETAAAARLNLVWYSLRCWRGGAAAVLAIHPILEAHGESYVTRLYDACHAVAVATVLDLAHAQLSSQVFYSTLARVTWNDIATFVAERFPRAPGKLYDADRSYIKRKAAV